MKSKNQSIDVSLGSKEAKLNSELVQILKDIEEYGSMYQVSRNKNVSYCCIHKKVRQFEKCYGIQLAVSEGAGGSVLTDDAKKLISEYESILFKVSGDVLRTDLVSKVCRELR